MIGQLMKKILFTFALASLLFASCSNDENVTGTDNDRIPATFSADISLTRASLSTWDPDDAIGIYMLDAGTTDIAEAAANRKHLTPAGDGKFSPAAADQTIYFPVDGTRKVDFIAYYPHTATLTGNIYKADISTQTTPASIDLMTARIASTADKPLDKDHTAVSFTFGHRLSRVEVNMEAGDGFTDADLAELVITLSNQPLKADFELLTDKLTPGSENGTITLNTATNGLTASAIILPQGGLTGRIMTFTMKNNSIFTWEVETDRTFEAGKKTVFNIRLARTGIEVTTSIQPWDTQGTVDGDADYNDTL